MGIWVTDNSPSSLKWAVILALFFEKRRQEKMEFTFFELFLLALSSFRLTRLLVYDKITAFFRNYFIDEKEEIDEDGEKAIYLVPKDGLIKGFFGELLSCYWCTGMWSSIAICVLYFIASTIMTPVIIILAVGGLAAIIETFIQKWL